MDVHGNRGKCAQGCRLPYTLLKNDTPIEKGYLLSPKDLCSLEMLPELIKTGITSLKIEGRMKNPEYVATVTKIYRKYIDKIMHNEKYEIEEQDKKDLIQVFNRGGFSLGHLSDKPNKSLIYKEKPNNMGVYIGNVSKYNSRKGHITLELIDESINIGDTITFEKENTNYTISELMNSKQNLVTGNPHSIVTIGRMKGNINSGDKIYKITSKELSNRIKKVLSSENKKQALNAVLDVHIGTPICLQLSDKCGHKVKIESTDFPEVAINSPITKEKLENQLNKLNNTPYFLKNIKINLDDNLFIPHISTINELRRNAIQKYSEIIINEYKRKIKNDICYPSLNIPNINVKANHKICLLLNILNLDFDYLQLKNVNKLYIPLKYFCTKKYDKVLKNLSYNFNLYIYLPNILKPNFRNLYKETINNTIKNYKIKGFVVSNIGNFDLLKEYRKDYELIGNFSLNIFNNISCDILDVDTVTISPELNKEEINVIAKNCRIPSEFIVYGNIPLMTSAYCLLGHSNKCYPNCTQKCNLNNKYFLKDRMNFLFRVLPDNIQTITTIYNSKINFIDVNEISSVTNFRIDILDENIEEINDIINFVLEGKRLEGKNYTNGNLNRIV